VVKTYTLGFSPSPATRKRGASNDILNFSGRLAKKYSSGGNKVGINKEVKSSVARATPRKSL